MSFLAVIALIALYEHYTLQPTWRDRDGRWRLWQGLKLYVGGLILADVVAGSITSLIAAYHFSNVPIDSAAGNLLAAPITGLWIMPWGLIRLALMPFEADGGALAMMGGGVDAINRVASMIAAWPSAQIQTPPMSVGALVSVGAGVLVVALWRGSWRWAGLAPIAFAVVQPWLSQAPDIVIGPVGGLRDLSDSSGHVVLSPGRSERFVRSIWVERYGRSDVKWAVREAQPPQLGLSCDSAECAAVRGRWRVSVATSQDAAGDDCGRSDILFAPTLFVSACGSTEIYDRRTFVHGGTHAVWIDDESVRVESVRDHIGSRVWNRERGSSQARSEPPINNGDINQPSDPGP